MEKIKTVDVLEKIVEAQDAHNWEGEQEIKDWLKDNNLILEEPEEDYYFDNVASKVTWPY